MGLDISLFLCRDRVVTVSCSEEGYTVTLYPAEKNGSKWKAVPHRECTFGPGSGRAGWMKPETNPYQGRTLPIRRKGSKLDCSTDIYRPLAEEEAIFGCLGEKAFCDALTMPLP